MSTVLEGLTAGVQPTVIPGYVRKEVIHTKQGGNIGIDAIVTKLRYTVGFPYLTATEFDLLETYLTAEGNDSVVTLSFTWKDRVHDGSTTDTKLNRVLNKVRIVSISIDEVYGDGISETSTTKAITLELEEV